MQLPGDVVLAQSAYVSRPHPPMNNYFICTLSFLFEQFKTSPLLSTSLSVWKTRNELGPDDTRFPDNWSLQKRP